MAVHVEGPSSPSVWYLVMTLSKPKICWAPLGGLIGKYSSGASGSHAEHVCRILGHVYIRSCSGGA